jgi:hypothetical protein
MNFTESEFQKRRVSTRAICSSETTENTSAVVRARRSGVRCHGPRVGRPKRAAARGDDASVNLLGPIDSIGHIVKFLEARGPMFAGGRPRSETALGLGMRRDRVC